MKYENTFVVADLFNIINIFSYIFVVTNTHTHT